MIEDARFEDAREAPLHLKAHDADDLRVISALVQDAVFSVREMAWDAKRRRFALLLNRFRWEDAMRERHGPERVRSLLVAEDAHKVASQGFDRANSDLVLSVLAVGFSASRDGAGRIELTLAGDGGIALDVEALNVTLKDVTKPYAAPSGSIPGHPE